MKTILTIIFIILAYINYRNLNIGFLSLYSIDEYAFHGSLLNMYDGLVSFNIKKLFSFGFYSYGFGFFFLNLFVTAPFFATDNIEMTIYIPRIITSLFAVGSVWFVYKTARLYSDKYISILIALVIITMPGFYRNALWFHPDWMMTFFIVLSVYWFAKDDFNYKKYFWLASSSLGLALATKIQAITFIPFVFLYIFHSNFQDKNINEIKLKILLFFKSLGLMISAFIFLNPYILHPLGLKAFVASFIENMKSNATNHGLNYDVTLTDKISNAIDFYYIDTVLFVAIFIVAILTASALFQKNNKKNIFSALSIYFIANIIYLFFMVNKDWQHYYLTIFVLVSLILLQFKNIKFFKSIMGGVILLQILTHTQQYENVVTKGYHPKKEISIKEKKQISDSLIEALQSSISSNTNILISSYQPFDFRTLGLTYKNIHGIYGPLVKHSINLKAFIEKSNSKDPSKFTEKDFIVLSKKDIYFNKEELNKRVDKLGFEKAIRIIENLNLGGNLGYEKFKETKYHYIWRKRK